MAFCLSQRHKRQVPGGLGFVRTVVPAPQWCVQKLLQRRPWRQQGWQRERALATHPFIWTFMSTNTHISPALTGVWLHIKQTVLLDWSPWVSPLSSSSLQEWVYLHPRFDPTCPQLPSRSTCVVFWLILATNKRFLPVLCQIILLVTRVFFMPFSVCLNVLFLCMEVFTQLLTNYN